MIACISFSQANKETRHKEMQAIFQKTVIFETLFNAAN